MSLNPTHFVHLANGQFDSTTPADLDKAFEAFQQSDSPSGWVVHFHGGIVSESSARETSQFLLPVYQQAGAYPFFFVWESGLVETVINNLRDIAREPFFRKVVSYLVEYLLGKFAGSSLLAAESMVSPTPPHENVEQFLQRRAPDTERTFPCVAPYDDISSRTVDGRIENVQLDAAELEALLAKDPEVVAAISDLNQQMQRPMSGVAAQEGMIYQTPGHLKPRALQELTGMHEHPSKVPHVQEAFLGITLGSVALTAVGIGVRVIRRFIKGRDHGLYTTVIEEVLRNLYIDDIGSTLFWNQMKRDTEDGFKDDPDRYGGTAFLQRLRKLAEEDGDFPKVTLVGHSAGAIYVCNFLLAASRYLPECIQFDVVLLAPAVDFELFEKAIETNRIRDIRMFAMNDSRESQDPLLASLLPRFDAVKYLYPRSLLYFVSGLLETEVDRPLLGMQRYHVEDQYTGRRFLSVSTVRRYLSNIPSSRIWSPSTGKRLGLNTDSSRHGDFDRDDALTLESLQHIIREGYGEQLGSDRSMVEKAIHPEVMDVIDRMSDREALSTMLNFNSSRKSAQTGTATDNLSKILERSMPTIASSRVQPDGELAKLTLKLLARNPANQFQLEEAIERIDDAPTPDDIGNDEFLQSLGEDLITDSDQPQQPIKLEKLSFELSDLVSQLVVRGQASESLQGTRSTGTPPPPSIDSVALRLALTDIHKHDIELVCTQLFGYADAKGDDVSAMVDHIVSEVGREGKSAEDVLVQVHQIVPYAGLVQRYLTPDEKSSSTLRETLSATPEMDVSEATPPPRPSRSMTIRLSSPDVDLKGIPGLQVLTQLENIVVARGDIESLNALESIPKVISIAESTQGGRDECIASMVDVKAIAAKSSSHEFGEQCLVAIIDGGIDVLHQAFQQPDQQNPPKTRIKGIWDLTSNDGLPPSGFENVGGTFHSEDDINGYLKRWHDQQIWDDPRGLKRDPRGHGTHVASIAAGTQPTDPIRRNQFPGGVAHAAPLLIVVTGNNVFEAGSPHHIGYSDSHIAALKFIDDFASDAKLPFVVNISQGEHAGGHDGTAALEVAIDQVTQMGRRPGAVIVKSAGNDRANLGHAYFTMGSRCAEKLEWNSDFRNGWPPGRKHDLIEIWFKPSAKMSFQLINPDDEVSLAVRYAQPSTVVSGTFNNGNFYRMEYSRRFRDNGHGRLRIEIRGSQTAAGNNAIQEGKWQLELVNFEDNLAQEIHAWVERSTDWQPVRFINFPSVDSTITVPGTAHSVITVGSVKLDPATAILRVSNFSGFGKTRDGRNKPELAAPGIQIKAAKSNSESDVVASDGTSMAAPHVSGAIALVLSKCHKRNEQSSTAIPSANEIRSECEAISGNQWNRGFGYGLLDVEALLKRFP